VALRACAAAGGRLASLLIRPDAAPRLAAAALDDALLGLLPALPPALRHAVDAARERDPMYATLVLSRRGKDESKIGQFAAVQALGWLALSATS